MCAGSGSWTRIPSTASSAFSSATSVEDLALGRVAPGSGGRASRSRPRATPCASSRRRRATPGRRRRGSSRGRRGPSSGDLPATSARTFTASAFPSMSVAGTGATLDDRWAWKAGLWLQPEPWSAGRRRRAMPVRISRTIRSAASAVMSAEPTAVGITSTTSAPTTSSSRRERRGRPEEVDRRHPARLRRPGARREGRVEDVDVDREEDGPVADDLDRPPDDLADPELADVVHEEARDPVLGLPGELGLARPVAAQADLDVAARVDVALLDEPVHRRPVRDLDAEDLGAGVGVGVEVDEADRAVAARRRRGCRARRSSGRRRARSGSRRRPAPGRRVASIAACVRTGSAGITGASPKSTTRSSAKASTFASRCGPGGQLAARIARGPKRVPGRSETRSSVGAPTIATSTPASSAGSSV